MSVLTVGPAHRVSGSIRPASDKSLTHRAVLLAAIANSPSHVSQPLLGEDCRATMRCVEAMGAKVEVGEDEITVHPATEWSSPQTDLDCGNSGTTMRLLAGLIASRPIEARLVGDASLSRRPMGRIAEPLRLMGATLEGDRPPIMVRGGALRGIAYTSPVASAQIKSCILLAGLRAQGVTQVTEPSLSRDHTERMLHALGVPLTRESAPNGAHTVRLEAATFAGFQISVPADISSAAFWLVLAAAFPGAEVVLRDVGVNPTRTGVLDVLERAGANVRSTHAQTAMGEPIANLHIHGAEALRAFEVGGPDIPRLIDEIPVLAVLATQCSGTSIFGDAHELRVKESDRIKKTVELITALGGTAREREDGLEVDGPTPLHGGTIDADGDHRIAMAAVIGGCLARSGTTTVSGADSITTSYPDFMNHLEALTRG